MLDVYRASASGAHMIRRKALSDVDGCHAVRPCTQTYSAFVRFNCNVNARPCKWYIAIKYISEHTPDRETFRVLLRGEPLDTVIHVASSELSRAPPVATFKRLHSYLRETWVCSKRHALVAQLLVLRENDHRQHLSTQLEYA